MASWIRRDDVSLGSGETRESKHQALPPYLSAPVSARLQENKNKPLSTTDDPSYATTLRSGTKPSISFPMESTSPSMVPSASPSLSPGGSPSLRRTLLLLVTLLPGAAHAVRHLTFMSSTGHADLFRPDPKYLNGLIQAGFTRQQAAKALEVRLELHTALP